MDFRRQAFTRAPEEVTALFARKPLRGDAAWPGQYGQIKRSELRRDLSKHRGLTDHSVVEYTTANMHTGSQKLTTREATQQWRLEL